jgi:hypothetical protein
MTRKENNTEILKLLTEYFNRPENEDIRFFQGLSNLGVFTQQMNSEMICTGIDDPYFQDSSNTLMRINQKL